MWPRFFGDRDRLLLSDEFNDSLGDCDVFSDGLSRDFDLWRFCHHDPKKILQIANDFSGVFSFLVTRILSDVFLHRVDLL